MSETAAPEAPATDETAGDGEPTQRVGSASGWKRRAVHEGITLPSGTVVDIRLPSLPKMLKGGDLPNHLIDAAIKTQNAQKITREGLEESWDFTKFIVPLTVVNPEITQADVDELPMEDVEMLVGFASRTIDTDAIGHHLAGLERVRSFRDHRGIFTTDEALLSQ